MIKNKINKEYFNWLCQFIRKPYFMSKSFYKLLYFLHTTDFNYIIDMDSNREDDGIELRYRFGYENSYDNPLIASFLDNRACSVLEMMVALAIRCEEHIMSDPDVGNRTWKWFWNMIKNLGLESMTDDNFDNDYVEKVITCFLNREYKPNGEGGLFTVNHCKYDLRTVEIWYQMCWYLDEII